MLNIKPVAIEEVDKWQFPLTNWFGTLTSVKPPCQHENTEPIELASGLSHSFSPETVPGIQCLDCPEYWEVE